MIVEERKVVSVQYHLAVVKADKSEEFIEKTSDEDPLVFIFGTGQLLPAFEDNLLGKKVGDKFDFILDANNGYGEPDPTQIAAIPLDVFSEADGTLDNDMVRVGNVLPMMDNNGNHMRGTIVEVNADHVKMDFNHPMAGKTLHFQGTISDVRSATLDELAHGHVHGPGGHEH